jgi:hypothetical protein
MADLALNFYFYGGAILAVMSVPLVFIIHLLRVGLENITSNF